MATRTGNERRLLLWAMLLSSLIGMAIWYIRRLTSAPVNEWFTETVVMFSYFTNLTNLIAVVMAAALLAGKGALYRWFKSPVVQAACCARCQGNRPGIDLFRGIYWTQSEWPVRLHG